MKIPAKGTPVKVIGDLQEYECFIADVDATKGITIKELETGKERFCINFLDSGEDATAGTRREHFEFVLEEINANGAISKRAFFKRFPFKMEVIEGFCKPTPCAFE